MRICSTRTISAAFIAALMGTFGSTEGGAQTSFQNKTVTVVVGGASGIAYDVYARTLARHMGRYIPGNPGMIVQNMPGAGSMKAAEFMYTQAPKDGTTFAILFPGSLVEPLLSPGRFHYDPKRFEYLGTIDQDTRVCLTLARSKVKTFEDAKKYPAIMAGTQAGSTTVDYPNMLNALTGTKFKVVPGYKSTNETMLAMERGEADGMCSNLPTIASQKPEWWGPPEANMFLSVALNPHPEVVKRKIPSIFDLVDDDVRPVIELIASQQVFGRPFTLPPGTDPKALETLRTAFMATMSDAEFLKEIDAQKLDVNPLDGKSVSALIQKMYSAPKEVVDRMTKALKPQS